MRRVWTLGFILFLMVMPLSASGDVFVSIRSDQTLIIFETPLHSLAVEMQAIYPGIKSDLEKLTGWEIDFKPTFLLLTHGNFLSMTDTKNVVAFAVGRDYRIVIDSSRMNVNPFTLSATAKHELAHLLLHHKINRTLLPRWLDEGFAQWASDGISEIITGNQTLLASALIQRNLIPLNEIAHHFPENETYMILAYEQSKSLVEFIHREFGAATVLKILHHMADGDSIDDAVRANLSIPLDELERLWNKDLRSRKLWFYYLSTYLYAILFFLASVLAVIGFIRYKMKRKKWREEEE